MSGRGAALVAAVASCLIGLGSSSGDGGGYMTDLFQQVMSRMELEPEPVVPAGQRGGAGHMLPRDQEYLQHGAALWGHQYMAGGAGEGYQLLKPDGSVHNVHQVKTDAHLPAYCNPPNPCPVGYTSSDRCMEEMPNSMEFVREYQARQDCMCDKEHMISCPEGRDGAGASDRDMLTNAIQSILYPEEEGVKFTGKHIGLVAKKGDTWNLGHNPYLAGEKLPTVAKKAPGVY